jgi:hypothetical protein
MHNLPFVQYHFLMIPTLLSLLPLGLLRQCASAQTFSSVYTTTTPNSDTTIVSDISSNPISTSSGHTSSGLPGIPLTTTVNVRQNATATTSTTTQDITAIVGLSPSTDSINATAPATTARLRPTNTRPCNGYPEFCQRRFSNISMVVAHNSPFVKPHNAASNQEYPVLNQLNDGIRGCKSLYIQTRAAG